MDLSTEYLGFRLPHPFMAGASPLADELDTVRRLEDAGAPLIILRSLFEEQIVGEQMDAEHAFDLHADSFAEAQSHLPSSDDYVLGPEEYLEHLAKVKDAVDVPVISSLNGASLGGWLEFANLMKEAGADALELNLYQLATDPADSGEDIESRSVQIVREVKDRTGLPLAVKLSPFYSSLVHFVKQLELAGADGVVIFNRFFQPDIDIDELEMTRSLHLSTSSELLLRLRWMAILSGRCKLSLGITGGVHTTSDAIKSIMTGAHAVQMVSALLRNGPEYLYTIRRKVIEWLGDHQYESLEQMRGSMNLERTPDPTAYERANYITILQTARFSSL